MKKPIRYITPLFLLFLSGCQSYSAVNNFNSSEIYAKALHNTKKVDILEDNKIKLMFTVTSLNEVYPVNKDYQSFLLGIFEVNSKSFMNKSQIQAKFNTLELVSIEKLPKEHVLRENIVYKNPWAKYFIINFNKKAVNKIEEKENVEVESKKKLVKKPKNTLELKYKDSQWTKVTF